MTIGAVILGAGFARRFGSDKRIHPFADSSVARVTLTRYLAVFAKVRVVVRTEDLELQSHLKDLPLSVVTG